MELSRRLLLRAGLAGAAGTAFTAAGCSTSPKSGGSGSTSKTTTLWYWGGGLSDKVVADAVTHFASSTTVKPSIIGGDFKQKLVTTMSSGGQFVPDITGIKGEDMASFIPNANKFVDLNTLGADKLASQYLPWKWKKGSTKDGKVVGFPIDIGPTATFYRQDLFAKAGLPTDPAAVSAAISTWDAYFELGVTLKKGANAFLVNNIGSIFSTAIGQPSTRFIDENEKFVGDQDHMHSAWTTAVKPYQLGIDAKINDDSWNAAIASGGIAAEVGAAWHALDISQAGPGTKGKWRVAATPVGPANIGGSFLSIPKTSSNPDAAFQVLTWILNPDNQAKGFTDAALFPSSPATYKMSALTSPDEFFGGQVTIDVFGPAAEKIPVQYESAADAAVSAPYFSELTNIETKGKKPDQAWADAVSQAKQIAQRQGVN